jgi:hypothetical protein
LDWWDVAFLCSLYNDDRADHLGGRRDVEVQGLAALRRCEDRRVGERCLQLVERLLGLDGPGESFLFLQEPVEGQTLLAKPRDEATQSGQAT